MASINGYTHHLADYQLASKAALHLSCFYFWVPKTRWRGRLPLVQTRAGCPGTGSLLNIIPALYNSFSKHGGHTCIQLWPLNEVNNPFLMSRVRTCPSGGSILPSVLSTTTSGIPHQGSASTTSSMGGRALFCTQEVRGKHWQCPHHLLRAPETFPILLKNWTVIKGNEQDSVCTLPFSASSRTDQTRRPQRQQQPPALLCSLWARQGASFHLVTTGLRGSGKSRGCLRSFKPWKASSAPSVTTAYLKGAQIITFFQILMVLWLNSFLYYFVIYTLQHSK